MKLIRMLIAIGLACLSLTAVVCHAADEAGKVLFSRGVVSAVDGQDSRRGLRAGDAVYEGDRIITGRAGIVQIHLSDGALLGLRGSSEYQIKTQKFEPEEGIAEQAGELFSGWMRMITGAIGRTRPDNVRVGSSVATIGIRGTVFQLIHVPEEGLEGFNDVEPGSYVMLEDGRIDFFNEAGSRRLMPGDVAFVGLANRRPLPRPDRQELFARRLQQILAFRQEQQAERFRTALQMHLFNQYTSSVENSLQTVLDKELVQTTFKNIGALGSYIPAGRYQRLKAGESNLELLNTDTTRLLSRMAGDPGDGSVDLLFASGTATPLALGQTLIGGLASQVHWGIWREGSYTAVNSVTGAYSQTGDWHYILASKVQPDPALLSARLDGTFTYSYLGGTPLTNTQGLGSSVSPGSLGSIAAGQLQVDFTNSQMQAGLALNLPNQPTQVNVFGGGTLADFYNGSLNLADGTASVVGNMKGAFVGPTAEGAIATVGISDFGSNANYQGVAAFERTGAGSAVSVP